MEREFFALLVIYENTSENTEEKTSKNLKCCIFFNLIQFNVIFRKIPFLKHNCNSDSKGDFAH